MAKWQRSIFDKTEDSATRCTDGCVMTLEDYAENYRCVHQSEIQSAYYTYTQVTVIPIIGYVNCTTCGANCTEASVVISPDHIHDAYMVHNCTVQLLHHLQTKRKVRISKHIQCSDGCGTQFKSNIPCLLMNEECPWEKIYFGSRHGEKTGGIVKKKAETYVKNSRGSIRNAKELFDFCIDNLVVEGEDDCIHNRRVYFFVDNEHVKRPSSVPNLVCFKGMYVEHAPGKNCGPGVMKGMSYTNNSSDIHSECTPQHILEKTRRPNKIKGQRGGSVSQVRG